MDWEQPLLSTHMIADVPVDIRSILYVPSHRDRGLLSARPDYGLRLYARGVMIQQDNKDMLPNHFRFVEGVVESEDLPLNVSRETVQRNPAVRRIQKALVGKLIRELEDLAKEKEDEYARFWNEFGIFVKEGIATDPSTKDDLMPLLRFHSSKAADGDLISLSEYVERMPEGQGAIYYLLGENLDSISRSPHLDYFTAHDLEVLFLVDPVDGFMIASLAEYEDKPLKNVDDASLELPDDAREGEDADAAPPVPDEGFGALMARVVQVLGDKVTEVRESKVLRDSPCRLVSPEGGPGSDMQRVYKLLNREFETPKKILELNRGHPLIRNLAHLVDATPDAPVIDLIVEQLFENQLLVEGVHPNPISMIGRIQALMEAATAQGRADSE
jgi:molecular chaperone HtpG